MSNTQRPSLQRKHTRKTEENRTAGLEQGMTITVDGEAYTVRLGDVSPTLGREVRRIYGVGVRGFFGQLAHDPDLDLVAGFIWMARRIRGEYVELEDVESQLTYASLDNADVGLADENEAAISDSVEDLSPEG